MSVNIEKVNLTDLVIHLWYNAVPEDNVRNLLNPILLDENEIKKILDTTKKFDYLCGRALKVDLSGSTVDPKRYNSFGYMQNFEEIVQHLS
jgi:hypothetical protein